MVPLPHVVIDALAAHLATWPADEFVFTTELGGPIRRTAFSAAVYVLATVALTRTGPRWHRVATAAVLVELAGVLGVGLLSVLEPALFPEASVWSHFGRGYGYVPLVLPLIGLSWLWHTRPHRGVSRTG